jgi:hypothetical protein
VLTNKPAHNPILISIIPSLFPPNYQKTQKRKYIPTILPLLICLTVLGFRCPFCRTGVLAFLLYESAEKTSLPKGFESILMGRWWRAWYVATERPSPRPRAWGLKRGRRRREAILTRLRFFENWFW